MREYAVARAAPDRAVRTEVVIVGNGPSALSLSQLLAGWEPLLEPSLEPGAHPDELLEARLRAAAPGVSLLEQDLRALAQGLEGRARTPLALLLDALERPGADAGLERPSLLRWRLRTERAVDHVALGRGPPGGAWQAMDPSILTLSLASWMELPGLSFRAWESSCGGGGGARGGGGGGGRVSAAAVARYYADYVKARGISRYVRSGCVVTAVRPLGDPEGLWLVEGYEEAAAPGGAGGGQRRRRRRRFCYLARHVVLASGAFDRPNALGVPGEALAHRDLRALERALDALAQEHDARGSTPDPVLVVGAGLSAADAVIAARHRGLPVLHAFRRQVTQLELTQLPSSMYPEYHKVHQMMRDGGASYPRYSSLPETHLVALRPGRAWLLGPKSHTTESPMDSSEIDFPSSTVNSGAWYNVSATAVLVGARPDLRYLRLPGGDTNLLAMDPSRPIEPKSNPIDVDPVSYRVLNAPKGLFALGPLAGDTFVRFVLGGAVGVAAHVQKQR